MHRCTTSLVGSAPQSSLRVVSAEKRAAELLKGKVLKTSNLVELHGPDLDGGLTHVLHSKHIRH